ncbi:hypothetical protein AXF24_12440 [Streptococcus pneumoniae]|nr:hypothetical protein AXF24_12440 [Streptococcus pneumoniae]
MQVGLNSIDGVKQHFSLRGTGRFQQINAGRIAVKDLGAKLTQRFDMIGIVVQHHGMHVIGQQQTAGDLPERLCIKWVSG